MSNPLILRLFGAFEVRQGETVVDLTHRKADHILAYLALNGGFVSREKLQARFWPDAGSNAMDHGMGELRRKIGADCLQGRLGQVRIDPEKVRCDVWEFDHGLSDLEKRGRLRTLADEDEYQRVRDAVSHYAGPLLSDWDQEGSDRSSENWLILERGNRERRYLAALFGLRHYALQAGRPAEAMEWLRLSGLYVAPSADEWLPVIQAVRDARGTAEAVIAFETYGDLCVRHGVAPSDHLRHTTKDAKGMPVPASTMAVVPGGILTTDSPSYVARSADAVFLDALRENVGIINIKGAPDTGKASLVARGLAAAQAQGFRILSTDFREMAQGDWDSIERVCRFLMGKAQEWLEPEHSAAFAWDDRRDAQANLTRFVERVLLQSSVNPVCWDLGRVDYLFHGASRNAFFSLLRSWTERRSKPNFPNWRRLLLVETTTLEPALFISDPARSPFNTGKTIEVTDLTLTEVRQLNFQLGKPATALEIEEIFQWLDGHPLLTHQTLVDIREGGMTFTDWKERRLRDNGPFGEHLRAARYWLEKRPELACAVRGVLNGRPCTDAEFHALRSAGILDGDRDDGPRLRCQVYERYLMQNLAKPVP